MKTETITRYVLPLFALAAAYVGLALIDAGHLIGLAYIAAGGIAAQVALDARAQKENAQ